METIWSAYLDRWRQIVGKGEEPKLTDKRRRMIRARLSDGYAVEQLVAAVTGLFGSDFHCGQNDRGQKYLGIEYAVRDGEAVERFSAPRAAPTSRTILRARDIRQPPAPDRAARWREQAR